MQNDNNVFFTMVETVVKNKITAIVVTLVGVALSFTIAFTSPEKFQGVIDFKIIVSQETNRPTSIAASLNLPGLSGGQNESVSENLSILSSHVLTERFIREYNLLPVLYEDKWDSEQNKWLIDGDEIAPTLWKATRLFDTKVRTISLDKETQHIEMTMLWTDPETATYWANEYLAYADKYIAELARVEVKGRIEFIQSQLNENLQNEIRQSLIYLLQEELKKDVLLKTSKSYAFKVLDPAVVPELKSEPQKGLIVVSGSLLSLIIGILAALVKESFSVYLARTKAEKTSS